MRLNAHDISRELFDSLAEGGGGPEAISALSAAEYSKHLLLLRGIVEEAERAGTDQAQLSREGYALLAAVQREDPLAAREVIGYPAVGARLLRILHGLLGETPVAGPGPAGLAALAAAAAIRAGVPAEVEVRPVAGAVHLPSLGTVAVDAPIATAHVSAGAAEIRTPHSTVRIPSDRDQDAPGWQSLRHIREGAFHVIVDDLDPFRMPAVIRDRDIARLGVAEIGSWRRSIQQGWRLLTAHHPGTAEEVRTTIAVLVPLASPPQGQVSSSSPDTFGAVALSIPPDPHTCAVTLAHEVQHLKLSALHDISPLLLPEDGRRYYAPWRRDPRPLGGLLQGAYAHVGICGFWRRERQFARGSVLTRADREFARWRIGIERAISILLASSGLTPAGVRFVEGMARTLSSWQGDPVPAAAHRYAVREAQDHLQRWNEANGRPCA